MCVKELIKLPVFGTSGLRKFIVTYLSFNRLEFDLKHFYADEKDRNIFNFDDSAKSLILSFFDYAQNDNIRLYDNIRLFTNSSILV